MARTVQAPRGERRVRTTRNTRAAQWYNQRACFLSFAVITWVGSPYTARTLQAETPRKASIESSLSRFSWREDADESLVQPHARLKAESTGCLPYRACATTGVAKTSTIKPITV